jgi:hypothetical protein
VNESKVFLEALLSGKPAELYLLIWTVRDKASHWFQDSDAAIQFIASITTHDVYTGVGFSRRNFGTSKRCVASEITGIPGMWADIDIKSEAHPQPTLPTTIEEARSILPPEFLPTFLIMTGNGIQAWWLFREPWIFQNENERHEAARLAYRWHSMLRDNASERGYTSDRLADLARVLRVPGTTNCKDPSNPKPVTIESHSEHRYNPSELTWHLDSLGVADQDAEFRMGGHCSDRFRDNPLKIDLSARIDEDRLKAWSEADKRFNATWFRQRHDLKDQSQSGYDQSLADFGVKVGLFDQEIVNLIVRHRAVHKQKSRSGINYYELTIAKARASRLSRSDSASETPVNEIPESPGQSRTGPAKSDREKIQLCKSISAAFGIEVLRMVKVSGDNPLYRMDLAAGSISFSGVDKLISKPAVRNAIAGKVGILIPEFRPGAWRNLVQIMLDACINQDGGEELESQGAARLSIRQYLAETTFISGIAGQMPQDLRKPMVRDDQIAICASDFQTYLSKARSQAVSVSAVVAMLTAAGAKLERVRGKFKEQSRWMLPLDEFDPADYASTMPGGFPEHA